MCPYKNRELPISVNTKLAALIGWPLGHSASAEMHNDAYAAMGLDAIYLPLPVEPQNVTEAVKAMETMGFMGCNVTIPHKVAVKELMDELHPSAAESGAVNTVLFKEGRRIGYNTDGTGFVHALIEKGGFHPSGKSCLMIGAGGAARGVASALAISGAAKFLIANRAEEYEMAERLADDMNALRPGSARPLVLDKKSVGGALEETELRCPRDASWDAPERRYGRLRHLASLAAPLCLRRRLQPAGDAPSARGGRARLPDAGRHVDARISGSGGGAYLDWHGASC